MNRLRAVLPGFFLVLALSSPVWAHETWSHKLPWLVKNDTHYGHDAFKINKQKMKALKQFRELKKAYERTGGEARQMFMEFISPALCNPDAEIQKVRENYQQQIAQLDATIASYQKQIADMEASHQADLDQLSAECSAQKESAYQDALAACQEACAGAGSAEEIQMVSSWSTGTLYPSALDVDNSGNTYIVDRDSLSVVIFDSTGTQTSEWTSELLGWPLDLAVDSNGNVYVLDQNAPAHLQKYGRDGQPLPFISTSSYISRYPKGLFIDNNDTIYVADSRGGTYGSRILMFNTSGEFLGKLGEVPELASEEYRDLAVDEQNHVIYLVTNYRVAKFDTAGNLIGSWTGTLNSPNSIAIGNQGQVFVADTYNNEIDQYDADGNMVASFGSDVLSKPSRIAVDNTGKLYIADEANLLIRVYQ